MKKGSRVVSMGLIGAISLIIGFGSALMSPADSAPLFPQEPELANGEAEVNDCILLAGLDCIVCIPVCAVDVTGAGCVTCLLICSGTPI